MIYRQRILERLLYFAVYIVIDPGDTLTKSDSHGKRIPGYEGKYEDDFKAGMGTNGQELLMQIDCDKLSFELKAELKEATGQKRQSS